jgi:hypothetical protein
MTQSDKLKRNTKMTKLISQNENGIIYVENGEEQIFGIVSATQITDQDGLSYEEDTLTVLEKNGFELEQDWENETTYIDFIQENGETSRVLFNNNSVEIIEA